MGKSEEGKDTPLKTKIGERVFIEEIEKEINLGNGVVPFVGSGISANSGILMGMEFNQVLAVAIIRFAIKKHDPRTHGWPLAPDSRDLKNLGEIENDEYDDQLTSDLVNLAKECATSLIDREDTKWKWFQALELLSQLVWKSDVGTDRLRIQEPDQSIIDSFNQTITRNRKPNLAHTMIARLLRSLRSRLILTTNFDTLLEESIRAIGRETQVFAISSKGQLPSPATVCSAESLIKLHGDILETRADETLNHSPTISDKKSFFEYLRGTFDSESQREGMTPNHLLVVGYSGSDRRCRKMIEFVLDFDRDFKVFWVCHVPADENSIHKHFGKYEGRILTCVTQRTDLLLYELYQILNHSLPGGGFTYEFTHSVPPGPLEYGEEWEELSQKEKNRELLKSTITQNKDDIGELLLFSEDTGMARQAKILFHLLEGEWKKCIWLDLDDYSNVRNLAFHILAVLSLRQGFFQSQHINLVPAHLAPWDPGTNSKDGFKNHLREVFRVLNIEPSECWIFLYGRNGPGACSGFLGKFWNKNDYSNLHNMMNLWREFGVNFVYMVMSPGRFESNEGKEKYMSGLVDQIAKRFGSTTAVVTASRSEYTLDPASIDTEFDVANIEPTDISGKLDTAPFEEQKQFIDVFGKEIPVWLGIDSERIEGKHFLRLSDLEEKLSKHNDNEELIQKIQFLYALSLFRQSRHPAALVSEATIPCPNQFNIEGKDNDQIRYDWSNKWIQELATRGVLLRKPGGYSWKYRDIRVGIRHMFECLGGFSTKDKPKIGSLITKRARTHFWIGEWYFRAFLSSGHYLPLIECLYHRIQVIKWFPFAEPSGNAKYRSKKSYQRHLANLAITEALKAARLGRKYFKFWLPGLEINGFSKIELEKLLENSKSQFEREVSDEGDIEDDETWEPHFWSSFLEEIDDLRVAILEEGGRADQKSCRIIEFPLPDRSSESVVSVEVSDEDLLSLDGIERFKEELNKIVGNDLDIVDELIELANPRQGYGDEKACSERARALKRKIMSWKIGWIDSSLTRTDNDLYVNQARLRSLVWLLTELAYSLTKYARFVSLKTRWTNDHGAIKVKVLWSGVSVISWCAIDLLKNFHPALIEEENVLKVRCLSIYGLALGYLCRYQEGHRRLNEAHAALSKSAQGLSGVPFAALNLRRGEIYQWQATDLLSKINTKVSGGDAEDDEISLLKKQAVAAINDIWPCLELAEQALSGVVHSSTWWFRLRCLKLDCFILLGKLFREHSSGTPLQALPMKRCGDLKSFIEGVYWRGKAVCDWSIVRRVGIAMRCLDVLNNLKGLGYDPNDDQVSQMKAAVNQDLDILSIEIAALAEKNKGSLILPSGLMELKAIISNYDRDLSVER